MNTKIEKLIVDKSMLWFRTVSDRATLSSELQFLFDMCSLFNELKAAELLVLTLKDRIDRS